MEYKPIVVENDDDDKLKSLGYKPMLSRSLSWLMSFAIGFTRVNTVTQGIAPMFGFGIRTGGPVAMVWGWIFSSFMTLIVGLCLAEICGIFPTTGSVYDWTSKLASPTYSPVLSYWTGLAIWLGNSSGNSTTALYLTTTISSILASSGLQSLSSPAQSAISMLLVLLWSLLNFLGVEKLGWLSELSAGLLFVTTILISTTLLSMSPKLQSSGFVFFDFENSTGWDQPFYVLGLSVLFPLFSFSGYEASSLVAEETKNASIVAPFGIISTIVASSIGGFVFVLSLLYSIQDINSLTNEEDNSSISKLFLQATNNSSITNFFSYLLIFNAFLCGLCNSTLSARITYALGRDNMIPFSNFVSKLDPYNKSPRNAIVFVLIFNLVLLLLPLTSVGYIAFSNIASICTIGYQVSYAIPILCRVIFDNGSRDFSKSYIYLGNYSKPLGIASFIWLCISTILFMLPYQYPINEYNMNYSIVFACIFSFFAWLYWIYYLLPYHKNVNQESLDIALT